MVPPFLAFHALLENDEELMLVSVEQCLLYRQEIQDNQSGVKGLWRHIHGPENEDPGYWSTGNGWIALGILRVLATIKIWNKRHSSSAIDDMESILESAIIEIILAAKQTSRSNGLLRNYLLDESSFGECAGTAAIAAAVYRMTMFGDVPDDCLSWAHDCRSAVLSNVKEDGAVGPVVNPMNPKDSGEQQSSAEGQAFILLLEAAHRDWFDSQRQS